MGTNSKDDDKAIKIKRPKRRVRTPLKTGTVVHKSPRTYTRKKKHKAKPEDTGND